MSRRLDRTWRVVKSVETEDGLRCVDFFIRPDGSYGFEEFRKDFEDPASGWRPVSCYSGLQFDNKAAACNAARNAVGWLDVRE